MQGNEEIIIRVSENGRSYVFWTRPIFHPFSVPRQAETNKYTSAATMATAIQAAMPTLTP